MMDEGKVIEILTDFLAGKIHPSTVWGMANDLLTHIHKSNLEIVTNHSWQTLNEFNGSYEGWCWIVYKGRVVEAYFASRRFWFDQPRSGNYMTECISAVMPWTAPNPPHQARRTLRDHGPIIWEK